MVSPVYANFQQDGSGVAVDAESGNLLLLLANAPKVTVAKATGGLTVGPAGAGPITAGAASLASISGATTIAGTTLNVTDINATTVGKAAAVTTLNATTGNIATVKATTIEKTTAGSLTVNADTVNAPTMTATTLAKTAGASLTVNADTVNAPTMTATTLAKTAGASLTVTADTLTGNLHTCTVTNRAKQFQLPYDAWRAGAAGAAPAAIVAIVDELQGHGFSLDAHAACTQFCVPADFSTGNLTLRLYWAPASGSAIPDTKKVMWDATIRSRPIGQVYDAGSVYVASGSFTQTGGAGTDKQLLTTDITIDPANVNQPVAATHLMTIQLSRDVTGEGGDTYAAAAVFMGASLFYNSTTI